MLKLTLAFLLLVIESECLHNILSPYKKEAFMNFTERTEMYGYKSEQHTVTTEDGYILSMFRMLKGKHCEGELKKPPILLQHGVACSPVSWLDVGPSQGLPYLLADACYDVWCTSSRGSEYSRQHVSLDPNKDHEFWEFSYDKMGTHDLPAFIDYITQDTDSEKNFYMGHSQGGTILFILLSALPEYLNKIIAGITFAPGTNVKNTKTPARMIAPSYQGVLAFTNLLRFSTLFKNPSLTKSVIEIMCTPNIMANTLCKFFFDFVIGGNSESRDEKTMAILYGHFPDSVAIRNLAHYAQAVNTGKFQPYDYGEEKNMELYGSPTVEEYDLSGIDIPIYVLYGRGDKLVVVEDMESFQDKVPNHIEFYEIDDPKWDHCDYIWSKYISTKLFPKLIEILQNYTS